VLILLKTMYSLEKGGTRIAQKPVGASYHIGEYSQGLGTIFTPRLGNIKDFFIFLSLYVANNVNTGLNIE
jgi:hypothetical protein